ncbi:MAG: preprotein translocase subunit SecG, partial [Succinivibrionaceae bacterium]|nr:preprotein translocase subunit SecG [Succinivibrionaceae bacterium]
MYEITIVIFLLVAIAIIALILVQQGKGAGMGASFGAGASNTVFGSVGSGNFLTRSTWALALIFFGICLFIGWMQKESHESAGGDFENIAVESAGAAAPADVPVVGGDVP